MIITLFIWLVVGIFWVSWKIFQENRQGKSKIDLVRVIIFGTFFGALFTLFLLVVINKDIFQDIEFNGILKFALSMFVLYIAYTIYKAIEDRKKLREAKRKREFIYKMQGFDKRQEQIKQRGKEVKEVCKKNLWNV